MHDAPTLFLVAVVAVLGVTRATQIALHDRILQAPREWLTRRVNPRRLKPGHPDLGYVGYLIQCPWCLSVWIGAAAVAGLSWNPGVTIRVLAALGLSLLAVVVDRLIDLYAGDEAAAAREAAEAQVVVVAEEQVPDAVRAALDPTGDDPTAGAS